MSSKNRLAIDPQCRAQALSRMIAEAGDAQAYFHTWKALNVARGHAESLKAMNAWCYVDFFHVIIWGSLNLSFLSVGKMFDRSSESLGVHKLATVLEDEKLQKDICRVEKDHDKTICKIRRIRNKSVAHNDMNLNSDALFDESEITPDQVESLLKDVCEVLNSAARRQDFPDIVLDGLRFEKAVQHLLATLQDGRV